jgi:hypothetical protein
MEEAHKNMNKLEFPETKKIVVAHNNEDIFQVLIVEPNNCLETGQPYMDIFDNIEDGISAFPQLSTNFLNLSSRFLGLPLERPLPPLPRLPIDQNPNEEIT